MAAGPKPAVDQSLLPWRSDSTGALGFAAFCRKFIRVPKGTGALSPFRLRDWQIGLVGSVLDADPTPRIAGWCLPRGQGKSTLVAALGLYELMTGGEGATVIVAAVDERQAGIVFRIACRMVELNDELNSRVQVFKDRLVVPCRGASFTCLPASPASLEGLDYSLAICDEIGRIDPETWQVIALASGKRERSTLIGIGTPGPREDNVLAQLREYAAGHPEDTSQVYVEFSAAGFEDHPVDCEHCWALANPALGDFLYADALRALLPPKTTEGNFRRARLCQFVNTNENPFIAPEIWESLNTHHPVPDGAEVVIALDGSWGGADADATALVVGTISPTPHFDVLGVWQNDGSPEWRVPVLEVEDKIRQARNRFKVCELVADPFRWGRSLQVLAAEGLGVTEFPWSPARTTRATTDLFSAATAGKFTHSGDETLTRHVLSATVIESNGGLRIGKASRRRSAAKIDCAAALLMCHSRCAWHATKPVKRNEAWSFA
ncbi:terminase [Mycobacterium sp. IEC1808]|uniref:terminase large subunit domain-containing protein n=1 Tax=Mycobacterium sp. IEC1808 TaxID=1743230 RepID=UPI000A169583|nr:terminase large subunit [Mycobacterium sp. IEC1808]ORW91285.1 terminase [Mycobacterium sp. IEC1808]